MSSPFVGEWTIRTWMADSQIVPEGIPVDAFQEGDSLNISPAPAPNSVTFQLEWHNQNRDSRFASGLYRALDLEQAKLKGKNIPVNFGAGEVACDFTLTLTQPAGTKELSCTVSRTVRLTPGGITSLKPTTGSGTFTATANPEPPFATDADAAGKR